MQPIKTVLVGAPFLILLVHTGMSFQFYDEADFNFDAKRHEAQNYFDSGYPSFAWTQDSITDGDDDEEDDVNDDKALQEKDHHNHDEAFAQQLRHWTEEMENDVENSIYYNPEKPPPRPVQEEKKTKEIADDVLGYYLEHKRTTPAPLPMVKRKKVAKRFKNRRASSKKTQGYSNQAPYRKKNFPRSPPIKPMEKRVDGESGDNRSQRMEKKIRHSVETILPKMGKKLLTDILDNDNLLHKRQDLLSSRSVLNAFAPDHVTVHLVANWVNVLSITVAWLGIGAIYSSSTSSGRSIDEPWMNFIPNSDQVATALRDIADVADNWHHDEL